MLSIIDQYSYFEFFIFIFLMMVVRYLIVAVPLYSLFWIWKPTWTEKSKIQPKSRHKAIPKAELLYSLSTLFVTALWGAVLFWIYKQGFLRIYTEINGAAGYAYMVFTIFISMVIHDAYFYLAHRLMHTRKLFHYVHAVHHKSMNPTPFASFSFHPIEAFFEVFFLLPLLLILPMHPYAIFIFLFLTFFFNVAGHLGHELNPAGMWEKWWGRWLTTPTHHNLHHQLFNCNYALYYRHWDRMFNTLHASTGKVFNEIKARK